MTRATRHDPGALQVFSGLAINVVGDVMLDEYLVASDARVSPEAPVLALRVGERFVRPGGAANVAANCAALGARVTLAGVVGDDAAGAELLLACEAAGIDVRALRRLKDRPTTRKQRVLSREQQIVRLDWESTAPVAPADLAPAFAALPAGDAWLLSDYAKGVLHAHTLGPAMRSALDAGVPVVVDPKRPDVGLYSGATVLTPNEREVRSAAAFMGAAVDASTALAASAQGVRRRAEARALLVTRGADGMLLCTDDDERWIAAHRRPVHDTTGAGDTVTAVLGLGLAAGWTLADAAEWANLAAGLVVEKLGTATLSVSELAAAACDRAPTLEGAALLQQVAAWRRAGERIVFTNGCFDLLHGGHLALLHEAAAHGDRVVVAINSDASVRRLKGADRPVLPAHERAALLGALHAVDVVTVFDEDTPAALIAAVQPDVLVKGADYAKRDVVGADLVEARGGRVVLVPLADVRSTSDLLRAIRGP